MKLSDKILSLRKQKGLSQEELAEKLHVSRQTISRWEVGSAQPDAQNILQLSKLFGVSADYLLNDNYDTGHDVPSAKNPEAPENRKIKLAIALFASAFGLIGNLIIYTLSRFIEVMVPHITYENGQKLYYWNSELTSHSYKYFIQEYDLEFLTILFLGLFFAGLIYSFASSTKVKEFAFKHVKSKASEKNG